MVLLTFVWKCFQDRNFHRVVVGLYKQSIESWIGLMFDKCYISICKQGHIVCLFIDLHVNRVYFLSSQYVITI